MLLVLFGGVLADRFTPQLMMVGADAVRMLAMLALALLLATTDVTLWQIMALMALSGAATAMFQTGPGGPGPRVAEDVQRANALLRISEAVCTLLGPGLAAWWSALERGRFVHRHRGGVRAQRAGPAAAAQPGARTRARRSPPRRSGSGWRSAGGSSAPGRGCGA
ncbi:MFS transporter [Kitasatospora fiedleri]|uniref:hypothetical protein n=1 Tax=Kitasatospora fiedleri TaxID=2991545 RepID=UPI00249BB50B